jgi:hypothetical protein
MHPAKAGVNENEANGDRDARKDITEDAGVNSSND